jgi:hypothetical protein
VRRWRRGLRVVWRVFDGRVTILGGDLARLFVLNRTGTFLWQMLAEPKTEDEIGHELSKRFVVEAETARGDAARLLDDLRRRSLVELVDL